jgi:hypothetical protein
MLKCDFHIHTKFSKDADIEPKELLEKVKKEGIDVVGITDHNTIEGGKEFERLTKESGEKLIVFVGEEIDTGEGEVTALNINKNIRKKLGLVKTCKLIKEQGGFIIVPHAFDRLRKGVGKSVYKILNYIDAVEGLNSRSLFRKFNDKNVSFAKENNLPLVAGSDAHTIEEIGFAVTLVDSKMDKDEILKAIKSGKTKILGEGSGVKPHLKTFIQKFKV